MSTTTEILVDEWSGLYGESWKGIIDNDSFAHPAKFSRALIQKIYEHVIEEGWVSKGGSVIDPFGGVALGAFPAMQHGLCWTGCELEEKFVKLGNQNIALWNERFSRMPNWGSARLIQGDSRKLGEVLTAAECCVSSPPYTNEGVKRGSETGSDGSESRAKRRTSGGRLGASVLNADYGSSDGQLGAMKEGDHSLVLGISSPPYAGALGNAKNYADPDRAEKDSQRSIMSNAGASADKRYGSTEGQLGAMPEGQLCVTSPPWEVSADAQRTCTEQGTRARQATSERGSYAKKYGTADGNLGAMPEGFQAAVSSPPYEGSQVGSGEGDRKGWRGYTDIGGGTYADAAQLSAQTPETFWAASRLILEQLYQVIIPGGHAVFVVKAFVRDKKIVDFPAQWAQLCEAVGFRLLHDHHALLTEHYGTQGGFDEDKKLSVERKSFFRRLSESKGSPRIDYEQVLCFKKIRAPYLNSQR